MREHMGVVEIIFLDRLHNIYALFSFEYTDLVACVHDQNYLEQDATEGAHFGRQGILSFFNAHFECLAEFILGEQHFFNVAVFNFTTCLHLLNNYKNMNNLL